LRASDGGILAGVLEVVNGAVPERLSGAAGEGPIHQAAPGRALIDLPSVARVLVEAGRRATVARDREAGDDDLEWLLRGPVRQVGWLQRGTMALRASAVVIGGRAVALTGVAAAGKSAVAAALALRGHAVLADSALPVDIDGDVPVALAATDALELWPAAVEGLGLDPAAGAVVRPAIAKRAYRFAGAGSAPLGAVVLLDRMTDQGDPAAERVRGTESGELVARRTAMAPLLDPLGLRADHFRWVTRIAAATPVFHVRADRHRLDLGAVADVVEALAG
jgi:hypothetical protein